MNLLHLPQICELHFEDELVLHRGRQRGEFGTFQEVRENSCARTRRRRGIVKEIKCKKGKIRKGEIIVERGGAKDRGKRSARHQRTSGGETV